MKSLLRGDQFLATAGKDTDDPIDVRSVPANDHNLDNIQHSPLRSQSIPHTPPRLPTLTVKPGLKLPKSAERVGWKPTRIFTLYLHLVSPAA